MEVLIILLIVLLVSCAVLLYISIVQYKKNVFYEQFILELKNELNISYEQMKRVDILGSFESDDEIGQSFKIIKSVITRVNNLIQ